MLDVAYPKEVFGALAFVLTFALFVPYIRSIRAGVTVPHVFSWIIWAFGTFIVFAAQLTDGAGIGAWPIGLSACITGYVAYLAYGRRRQVSPTRADWVLFALALLALPSWAVTTDPLWAVVLLTTADHMGFGPTLRRAYSSPYQEHVGFFAIGAARNALVVLALEHYSWTTVLFPAAVGVACVLVAFFLVARRTTVRAETADG